MTLSVPAKTARGIKKAARGARWVSAPVPRAVDAIPAGEELQRRFLEYCDSVGVTDEEAKRAEASFQRITGRCSPDDAS